MFEYQTVEEKATEWNVTTRHIQHLCRRGKINGALKRAGAWFIPDNAPNPTKNTKPDSKPFMYIGTKKKIFENSIKLFALRGYENVSVNDIAESVGIRQSAVYNHFKSKQDILDTIYDFYTHNFLSNRPTMKDLDWVLQTGSLIEIITKGFIYEYDESVVGLMSDVIKIIIQRTMTDPRAAELFQSVLLEEGVRFVEKGLNKAVESGRLAAFDTHTVAILINCVRLYPLLWYLIKPPQEFHECIVKEEMAMYEQVAAMMTDLKSPSNPYLMALFSS